MGKNITSTDMERFLLLLKAASSLRRMRRDLEMVGMECGDSGLDQLARWTVAQCAKSQKRAYGEFRRVPRDAKVQKGVQ